MLDLRQLCNLSFVTQAQAFTDEDELDAWVRGLPAEPGMPQPRRRQQNVDAFLSSLGGPG